MLIFLLVFAAVCLWQVKIEFKLKPAGGDNYITDYMSIDKTMAIKGIFIIIVFFSHFNSYVDFSSTLDIAYNENFKLIGQRMVTLFMFYSGFGVMEAIKKKKMPYVHRIPVTRVAGTFFRFDIAVLLFLIMHLILGKGDAGMSAKRIILAFTSWGAIGNSNWYIFAILVCYLLTFIAFELFRDKGSYIPSVILLSVLMIAYIIIFHKLELRPTRYYNTVFCYVLGVYFSIFKNKFDKLFGSNIIIWALCLVASIVLTQYSYFKWMDNHRLYMYEISMFAFTAAVVLFTMHVSLNNKILRWFGEHLFSVYMLQRIPMIVFEKLGLAKWNIYVYFVVCFALTVVMAYFFEKYVGKLWKLISTPKKKKIA